MINILYFVSLCNEIKYIQNGLLYDKISAQKKLGPAWYFLDIFTIERKKN